MKLLREMEGVWVCEIELVSDFKDEWMQWSEILIFLILKPVILMLALAIYTISVGEIKGGVGKHSQIDPPPNSIKINLSFQFLNFKYKFKPQIVEIDKEWREIKRWERKNIALSLNLEKEMLNEKLKVMMDAPEGGWSVATIWS